MARRASRRRNLQPAAQIARRPEPTERKGGGPEDIELAGEVESRPTLPRELAEELEEEDRHEPPDRGRVAEDKGLDR
jgi:hypothetical protein